jgi:pSer/pThr/pTyr-binding forkhead associated (FHA) protein
LGGLVGWALAEPLNAGAVASASAPVYAHVFAYFLVLSAAIGAGLGALPGVLNRSRRQATRGALMGLLVGGLGGGLGGVPAQFAFQSLGAGLLARAVGWGIVGAAIGLCPAAATRDRRRAWRGLVGGLLGGSLGGLLFNLVAALVPQSPTDTGTASRLIADLVVGLCVGLAVAAVEAALKEAWLTAISGRREGAQFILSKGTTVIGRDDRDDVILWGDPDLACGHVRIERRDGRYTVESRAGEAPALLNGQPVLARAPLRDGDDVVVGSTHLRFQAHGAAPTVRAAASVRQTTGPRAGTPAPGWNSPDGPTAVRLVEVQGAPGVLPRTFVVPCQPVVSVGRGPNNAIRIDDDTVSTHHAELRWDEGHWVVQDLGSTNGTFVSDGGVREAERRVERQALALGSLVRFGGATLRLELAERPT